MAKRKIKPKAKGQKTISFTEGGLHRSLGVPAGRKIPERLFSEALAGRHGEKARKQAQFARNVLHRGKRR